MSESSNESHDGPDDELDSSAEVPQDPPPPPRSPGDGERPRIGIGPDGSIQHTTAPEGSWLSRLPLPVKIGGPIIIAVLVIGWWNSRGETTADDLSAGDCFEIPAADQFESVRNQSCEGEHEAEVVAVVQAPAGTPWPGAGDFQAAVAADEACIVAIDQLSLNEDNIPLDAERGFFFTEESDWNNGDREVICYVTSLTGLTGSVVSPG